jgi:hypothetical protein
MLVWHSCEIESQALVQAISPTFGVRPRLYSVSPSPYPVRE